MKKVIAIFISLLLFLTGCSSDEDYINSVKEMAFSDGSSVEEYVKDNIKAGEMYKLNDSILMSKEILFLLKFASKDEVLFLLNQGSVVVPQDIKEASWKVEGETKQGKVIVVSNDEIKVKIETEKDGDYIKVNTNQIFTYNEKANKLIPQEDLNIALELYNLAKKYGYENNSSEPVKRFNEKEILENKEGMYTLEYYPSGRVKYLSDDIMLELNLEDRSYLNEIDEALTELDGEIEKYSDDSINKLVDYSIELENEIIAEKLNKNITVKDRKEIKKLEEKAEKVFDKLQKQVDKTN